MYFFSLNILILYRVLALPVKKNMQTVKRKEKETCDVM